jgi:hypothetical protein
MSLTIHLRLKELFTYGKNEVLKTPSEGPTKQHTLKTSEKIFSICQEMTEDFISHSSVVK